MHRPTNVYGEAQIIFNNTSMTFNLFPDFRLENEGQVRIVQGIGHRFVQEQLGN
jgi:hypothetical protein